jgi:hypothetical protein
VPQGAFSGCTGLTNVTLGNGIANIGDYAFLYCTGLRSLNILDNVVRMGNALLSCYGLTNLTIGSGLTDLYIPNLYIAQERGDNRKHRRLIWGQIQQNQRFKSKM